MDDHHDHPIIKWLVGSTLTIFRRSDPYQIVGEISSKIIKSSVLSHYVLMFVQFCPYIICFIQYCSSTYYPIISKLSYCQTYCPLNPMKTACFVVIKPPLLKKWLVQVLSPQPWPNTPGSLVRFWLDLVRYGGFHKWMYTNSSMIGL